MKNIIKSLIVITLCYSFVFSQSAEEKFNQATKLLENGKPTEAITLAQSIENEVGANPKIYSLYVNAYLADGDYVNAKIALNKFKLLVGDKTSESIKAVLDKEREIDAGIERADKELAQKNLAEANRVVSASEQQNKEKQTALQNAPKNDPLAELELWKKIKNSNSASDFQSFLQQFPSGSFAEEAKGKLASLGDVEWNRLKNGTDVNALRAYINNPNSRYSAEAEKRLQMLAASMIEWEKLGDNPSNEQIHEYIRKYPESAFIKNANFVLMWNKTGMQASPKTLLSYRYIDIFSEELASVAIGEKNSAYINKKGQLVIVLPLSFSPGGYNDRGGFSNGLARVQKDATSESFFIDTTGKFVNVPKLDYAGTFKDGYIVGTDKGQNAYLIDKNGKTLKIASNTMSTIVSPFSEGLVWIGDWDKPRGSFYDSTGKKVITPNLKTSVAGQFSEGLAEVRINGKSGFIDKTGQIVIQPKYYSAKPFSEGLAEVCINSGNTCGFIDKSGKEVITPKYYSIDDGFKSGLAFVRTIKGNDWTKQFVGVIDKTGREVIPIEKYAGFWCKAFLEYGLIGVITHDKRKGFVDLEGNEYFDF